MCLVVDEGKGLALGKESAASGSCFGQYVLGMCCVGRGDDAEAVRMFRLAAAQGHGQSQFYMGQSYEDAWGVA